MHCVLFLIRRLGKNKIKDKDDRKEKWTKRIVGDNIIMDRWGKPDRNSRGVELV
jgi:hypothetical protein